MNVLSLFDGISCGFLALKRAKIKVDRYYASEIDKTAIKISQKNHSKIIHIGDVKNLMGWYLPTIDLLIGGSPCQDVSRAKRNGLGLLGDKCCLVWEFIRIFNETKPKWFLLENVPMKKEWCDIISKELGVEPVELNSNLVSAQNRKRLYWTNISSKFPIKDKGVKIQDIIYDDTHRIFVDERISNTKKISKTGVVKWDLTGKNYHSQQDRAYFKSGKICTIATCPNSIKIVLDYDKNIYRRIHPIEAERCQTLPDNYTSISNISLSERFRSIGNCWTVDIIVHILKNIK